MTFIYHFIATCFTDIYTIHFTYYKTPCFPGCQHALEIIQQKNNMGIIGIDLRIKKNNR